MKREKKLLTTLTVSIPVMIFFFVFLLAFPAKAMAWDTDIANLPSGDPPAPGVSTKTTDEYRDQIQEDRDEGVKNRVYGLPYPAIKDYDSDSNEKTVSLKVYCYIFLPHTVWTDHLDWTNLTLYFSKTPEIEDGKDYTFKFGRIDRGTPTDPNVKQILDTTVDLKIKDLEPGENEIKIKGHIDIPGGKDPKDGWFYIVVNFNEPYLDVTLEALPDSGSPDFKPVLVATADSKNIFGTYNWYFYSNRSDEEENVTPDFCDKDNNSDENPKSTDKCVYNTPGEYWAKVIVERGGLSAEARVKIVVSDHSLTCNGITMSESSNKDVPFIAVITAHATDNKAESDPDNHRLIADWQFYWDEDGDGPKGEVLKGELKDSPTRIIHRFDEPGRWRMVAIVKHEDQSNLPSPQTCTIETEFYGRKFGEGWQYEVSP